MRNDPLPRDAVERVYRLSPAQTGMLFHDLASPGRSPYDRQVSYRLEGVVDPACCEAAWNALLARHAMLRSLFDHERSAEPLQIILKAQTIDFHYENVEGGDGTRRVEAWRRADAERGFDLRRDRLMRVALFRRAVDRFELVWSHPHILLDGWSGVILAEEFARLYAVMRLGGVPDLPPAPDPDAHMAAMARRDGAAAARHWATLLEGYDELATLPRRSGGSAPQPRGKRRFEIPEADTAGLRALASRHGVTLGILLQALWGLLLSRWTGRQDVAFGIVTSGRSVPTPGIERLVGIFINTVPVRVRWSAGETIGSLLQRLQDQADEGTAHDHLGLAAIPNGADLLDHLLVLENFPEGDIDAAATGFRVTGTQTDERANYDFGLIVQAGHQLAIQIEHDAARIAPELVERLEQHWRTLVRAVLADPDAPLATIDSMPDAERRMISAAAQGPVVQRDETATIADLWHAQADATPDAPALVAGDVRFDYRTLDQAAEGVAERLRDDGIGRGDVVGVLAGRGAERIVALLGILKAGATYLPISPALPDQRIAMMLDDSGCIRVLADDLALARIEALRPGLSFSISGPSVAGRRLCPAAAGDIAYIIYTSGSTGRPKGVAVEHRGFVNMILAQIDGFGVRADDGVIQFASCSFDASVSEIFMALLKGARLVIAPEAAIRDGAALLALMAREGISVATLPPSYLRALERADLGALRVLITAGERPDPADARFYGARLEAFNAYGPTEASVCASWHRIEPDRPYHDGIPIGRPIANTGMTVRDRLGRLMPLGATGEICLTGRGLARGYAGQPALTAERFPLIDGERAYRTGDAGSVMEDGSILYTGRLDGQIKLNGHRIEIGEIEQSLRAHPGVAQAAVVVAGDPPGLIAHVVPRGAFDAGALRAALATTLPGWMVPGTILSLEALPTTIAGKIDRRALAAIRPSRDIDTAPLSPTEALVAEAFAAILGGDVYGRQSSFLASGGDSLKAIRLLGRLRRDGFRLDLADLLEADTVAAIARAGEDRSDRELQPVVGPVPLTPIQHWFFSVDPLGEARLHHQLLLRPLHPASDGRWLAEALDAIWRRHDALRLRFRREDKSWAAECLPSDRGFQLRTVDCRDETDPWARIATDAAANQPSTAGQAGPLFVATHYRLREGDRLLLAAHHLLVDAVSWRIVVEDIGDALRQRARGETVRLAAGCYRNWALALTGPDGIAAAERERPYWEALAGAAPSSPPAVPHGFDETELMTADLGPVEPGLSDRRILADILARLGAALRREGRRAVPVMLAHHGRGLLTPGPDASRTVGWFTADHPFLLECGAPVDAIETALAAAPAQRLGWGVLQWLSPDPIALAEPEFGLNYLGDTDMPPDSRFAIDDRLPAVVATGFRRTRAIELEAIRSGGRLGIAVRYAPHLHAEATIRALLDAIADTPAEQRGQDTASLVREGMES